ncbi:hypothetical protein AB1046_05300 [Promicromonospora sp. Populi]|uniref:hypothetical protein n=1 Tax=Promicromonospora sp. Populi TaxID=3239420 RepID=UPI0034E2423A
MRFVDLEHEPDLPHWDEGDHVLLGQGLELDLDDGSTWSVTWEQDGTNSGLGIYPEPLIPNHLVTGRSWAATRYWSQHGPGEIASIELGWFQAPPHDDAGAEPPHLCLAEMVLVGTNGVAVIVLDDRFDVLVCWSRAEALRAGNLGDYDKRYQDLIR